MIALDTIYTQQDWIQNLYVFHLFLFFRLIQAVEERDLDTIRMFMELPRDGTPKVIIQSNGKAKFKFDDSEKPVDHDNALVAKLNEALCLASQRGYLDVVLQLLRYHR